MSKILQGFMAKSNALKFKTLLKYINFTWKSYQKKLHMYMYFFK